MCIVCVCAYVNMQLSGNVRERISPLSPSQQETPKVLIGSLTLEVRECLEERIQPQGSPQSGGGGGRNERSFTI